MGSSAESLSDRRGDLGDISERQSMGFITSGILGESPHLSRPECLNVKWATGMSSVPGPAHMPVVRRSRGTPGADPGVLGSLSSLSLILLFGCFNRKAFQALSALIMPTEQVKTGCEKDMGKYLLYKSKI